MPCQNTLEILYAFNLGRYVLFLWVRKLRLKEVKAVARATWVRQQARSRASPPQSVHEGARMGVCRFLEEEHSKRKGNRQSLRRMLHTCEEQLSPEQLKLWVIAFRHRIVRGPDKFITGEQSVSV